MISRMAIRLTHILDEDTAEDGVRLLSILLRLMAAGQVQQRLIVIGRMPAGLRVPAEIEVSRIGRRFGLPIAAVYELRGVLARQQPDVIHAFSTAAAAAVGAVRSVFGGAPIVTTISDPADADRTSRWWRSISSGAVDVLCLSKIIQRKLIESGIPMDATAVIRPAVDFGELREAKERMRRADLGLPPKGPVFLTASPPSRAGGQFYAIWAVAMLHQIWPDLRLMIPGVSREQQRLRRLSERIYCPEVCILVEDRYTPAELLAVSDALIVPAVGETTTSWLAWAMAASVPIIGSAVPSIAEFIADRQNGFLCKPGEPHTLAMRIRTALESPDVVRQCTEQARGQAYDVFRAQRCVEEYSKVFRNLAAGERAIANVRDAAIDA